MPFLLERDALNGKSGQAYMTRNGENVQLFNFRSLNVNATFSEADFDVVGTLIVQKKTTGVQLTGTMTLYYGAPFFLEMLKNYINLQELPVISLQVVNDDKASQRGRQTVAVYGVKFASFPIALLDSQAQFLTMDAAFSFQSVEVLEAFSDLTELGQ